MTVAILVPYGGTEDEHRRRARTFVLDRYRRLHPDWPIIEGRCGEPWAKGVAVDDAYRRTDADVLVLADADCYVESEVLDEAVKRARSGVPWLVPHRLVFRLNEEQTQRVYAGQRPDLKQLQMFPYYGVAGGGIVVLTRSAYETVNGVDERFVGWGGEDVSLAMALHTLCAPQYRMTGKLIHLFHEPAVGPDRRGSQKSEELVARYKAALKDPAAMRALVEEHRGPRTPHDADGDHQPCLADRRARRLRQPGRGRDDERLAVLSVDGDGRGGRP